MDNTAELELKLKEVNDELSALQNKRYDLLNEIKTARLMRIDTEFAECNITPNMYILCFTKNTDAWAPVKSLFIRRVLHDEKLLDCIEGAYSENYNSYTYRTDLELMSFASFVEHKNAYTMYVCSKEQFYKTQLELCMHDIDITALSDYESEINCVAERLIS